MLFNDPYRPLIGTNHLAALGRAIREVLPETWDFLGPRFDRVMTHGQEAIMPGRLQLVYMVGAQPNSASITNFFLPLASAPAG